MSYRVTYFYRHPQPNYFSIEKLFQKISAKISQNFSSEFSVEEKHMPFTSKIKTIYRNILFTKSNQTKINHITGDIHYAIFGCSKKNINIITIHDCVTLYRYPKTSLKYWIIKSVWFDLPVKRADMISVISESTRRDLIHFTKCDPQKIRVIGNFADPRFQYSSFNFNQNCPRILFVGTTPNKNLGRLIEAVNGVSAKLVIIGALNAVQIEKLKTNNINYEHAEKISQEALQQKYRDCDIVAFPSIYEGFGLPILEAQATGRPLLTSDLSPMKDVAGNGACLIDPYNISSIKEGLLRIINNEEYRQQLISNGIENVKRFSLDKVAEQYASLYRELIQKKKT